MDPSTPLKSITDRWSMVFSAFVANAVFLTAGFLSPTSGWGTHTVLLAMFCAAVCAFLITFHILARIVGQPGLYSIVGLGASEAENAWRARIQIVVLHAIYPLFVVLSLLYLSSNAPGDRVIVRTSAYLVAACAAIFLTIPIYIRLVRADTDPTTPARVSQLVVAEKTFIIVGVLVGVYSAKVAAVALQETARANLSQTRGQLYAIEMQILDREANDERLSSIYNNKPRIYGLTKDRPQNYWDARLLNTLGFVARDGRLKGVPGVDQQTRALASRLNTLEKLDQWVYRRTYEELISETETERECRALLIKMASHFSAVMDHMHNAFDYKDQNILTKEERDTWMGYMSDIGAHPVFLLCIFNWVKEGYLSADFYEHAVKAKLKKNSESRAVFEQFLESQPGWAGMVKALGSYGPDS